MTGGGRYWSNEMRFKIWFGSEGQEKAQKFWPVGGGSSSHLLPPSSHTTLKVGILFSIYN